jgi:hypothetical protein
VAARRRAVVLDDFTEVVEARLRELEQQVADMRAQIGAIQADAGRKVDELQTALRSKEDLTARLRDVLRLEAAENGARDFDVDASVSLPMAGHSAQRNLADAAYELLSETRLEYHYRDLAEELLRRGVLIKGRDPAVNLIAHLVRDGRFIRPKRGVYALKELNPRTRSVGLRRRKASQKSPRPARQKA